MSRRYGTAEVDCDEDQIGRSISVNLGEIPAGADAATAAAATEASTHGGPSTSLRLNSTCSYHHAVLIWPDDPDSTQHQREVSTGPRCRPTRPEEVSYRGMNLPMACARGDLPLVAMLLAEGSDSGLNMYAADAEGNTPLHYACLSDNPDTIPFLIRKATRNPAPDRESASALTESQNSAMETPLLRAAAGGEVAVVRALLEAGADTFVWDVNGNTVFHNAARSGRLWVAAYFLSTRANCHQNHALAAPAAAAVSASTVDGNTGDGCGRGNDGSDEGGGTGLSSIAIESCDTGGTVTLSDCGIGNSTAAVDYAKPLFDGKDVDDHDNRRGAESDEHRANTASGGPGNVAGQSDERQGLGFPLVHESGAQERVAGGASKTPLGDRRTVECLLHRVDCDGHTALDWACYSGHTAVARLLVANGLDPFSMDPGGRTCLHWAASQGRTETCRYLVLLGLDPRLRDATGADAFQLAENYPSVARYALVLAEAVRRRVVKDRPVVTETAYGDRSYGDKRHAPTTGSETGGQLSAEDVEIQSRSAAAARTVVPPERLNPTRAWVVASYALPVCGAWALSFALPWWAWLLAILAVVVAFVKAVEAAAALSYNRSSGVEIVERSGGRGRYGYPANDVGNRRRQASADLRLLSVPELLLAPEKHLALWAGMALCFVSLTISVAARGLLDGSGRDGDRDVGDWSFAGAAIFQSGGGSSSDGDNGRSAMTTRAWLACATVVALVLTLALWSTLLAGDGRRAATEFSVAASTLAKAGDVGGFAGTKAIRGVLGWGDPGLVRIRPSEDMLELVEAVAAQGGAQGGAPEARTFCRTCLVRKPIRSKHCANCGFCVGRMDHHCVWINNCVGCGNHRRFVGFVLCQLAYAALFLWVSTSAFVEELHTEGGLRGIAARLLGKEYFPAVLLSITSAFGVLMLAVIAYEQVRNMFANLTINERVNRGRYPWLVVGPGGARFNHYDRGPWENFLEFWGIGSCGVGSGVTGRRHPRDYLEGYEIPALDAKQRIRLKYRASSACSRRQASRGSGGATLALRGLPEDFTPASIPASASGAPPAPPIGIRARHGDDSGGRGNATTAPAAAAAGADPHDVEEDPSRSVVLGVLGSSAVV